MDDFLELLRDNTSVTGRLVTSAAVVAVGVVVAWLLGRLLAARMDDAHSRYYARKAARYVTVALVVVVLSILWRAFAGRVGVVFGLTAAGVAFAMQEVIGALAGWFNILSGRIFRVGDRIQMGGVRGDVIDITPLRTKVMEIGSATDDQSWVRGRQFTGRIVAISNKATFTEPVFNYSAALDFVWDELAIPIAYDADWQRAIEIMEAEAVRVSSTDEAAAAVRALRRRYPVPDTELQPRVFTTPTDDYLELAARFMVPVRTARSVKDLLGRRIAERLAEEGIEVASTTTDVRIQQRDE